MKPRSDAALAASLFAALAVLFWSGRSHSFGPGDSAQHVVAALTWGVPHPPGYPLQTAVAHLWSSLPWSNPSAAVNGLSGLFSAGAAAMLFLLLRLQGCGVAASLAASGFMALSPLFWFYSLVAEVRGLNDLLAVSAAYLACRGSLLPLAGIVGLGLGHHPTFLFITPALLWWVWSARRPTQSDILKAALVAAVTLALPYIILGARLAHSSPAYNLYSVSGWADLPGLFLRENYGGPLRMTSGAGFGGFSLDFARLFEHAGWMLSSALRHVGPALLLCAPALAAPSRAAKGWLLWLGVSGALFLGIASQQVAICDPEYARAVIARHYLLPFVGFFALAGHGAQWLAGRIRPAFLSALAAAAFLAPALLAPLSLSKEDPLLTHARGMLRDSGPRDFLLLAADDSIFAAFYLDLIARESGDRVFLTPSLFTYPPYVRRLKRRHPDLVLPPFDPRAGLPTDWALWKKLNPGRAVLAEGVLRDTILERYPHSAVQGALLRVEENKPPKTDPRGDALRFLSQPENAFTRAWAREWTQEVYLLHGRRQMAELVGSRLSPARDQDLIIRLRALLEAL